MKKLWNWFVNWLTAPVQEYIKYAFECGKEAGRCEARTEQLRKQQDQQ